MMLTNARTRKPLNKQQSARVEHMKERFWERQRKRLNNSPPRRQGTVRSPSPLLQLPPELRTQIWHAALVRPRTRFRYTTSQFQPDQRNTYFRTMLSLMLSCRQIRDEAMALFLKHNHIVLYQMYTPQLPQPLRLDEHWFTKSPVPIRRLSLKGYHSLETPKLIASCPDLRFLCISRVALTNNLDVAAEAGKDAWILQYQTNLARLLSRRDGSIRVEGNGTFYEICLLVGCGVPVDTDEVVELVGNLKERCRAVAYSTQWKTKVDGVDEQVGSWIVRIGYNLGGVVTATLVRKAEAPPA